MSTGFNQVIVLGRLTAEPERIATKSGSVMLKATLEVITYRRGTDGKGEEIQARVPATLFGKLAEMFESYVAPGQLVQVIGRLDAFEKQGKDGKAWLTLNFIAEQLILLPSERRPKPTAEPPDRVKGTAAPQSGEVRRPPENPAQEVERNEYGEPTSLPF